MTDRLIRLMRIITLVQAKPGILARELAERCGNSERTIYRDMDALSAMHIPITHLGHGKGYAFIGNFALYPLDLTDDEAAAFSQLRKVMEHIRPLLPTEFETAYEKIMASQYKRNAEREETMESVKKEPRQSGTDWSKAQPEQPAFLTEILSAVMKQRSLLADYYENSCEELGIQIDPYCIVPLENRMYLIGACQRFGRIRAFHINGFSKVTVLDNWFSKERFDLQSFMSQKWSLDQDSVQIEFRVRFSKRMMERIKYEDLLVRPSKVDRQSSCLDFKVAVGQDIAFVRWLMKFEEEAEILEPFYYRDVLRQHIEKWLMLYK
ncbi:helix-turn-helix transcriptional regulator [Paenibacillus camerounensis]|uniref:helix-turn-helix transcriptional regulator n=1 Tax=Paenibacillus camerounensis TaxID=1243663 RepID=UPI0005A8779A|nr:WYL domain-containing protein [Paenibacillus camerounensis]